MRLGLALLLAAFWCSALIGCARTEKFDVFVRNETGGPVTLVLTKDGPPFEPLWAAPEDLAIESPRADEQHGYVVLPPGREADVSVEGKFDSGTRGYLRVYRGDLQISEMVAINSASPNRLDLPLQPGANRFLIAEINGRLAQGGLASDAPPPSPAP
jgi:hypothetical protein